MILLKALCVYMIFTFICIQTLSVNQYTWFSCLNTDTHTHTHILVSSRYGHWQEEIFV